MVLYIKSIWVGVVALFATTIVYVVILTFVLLRLHPPPPATHVAFDLRILNRPSFWVIADVSFALAFYWEFRRASR